jgi:hypothetical protein
MFATPHDPAARNHRNLVSRETSVFDRGPSPWYMGSMAAFAADLLRQAIRSPAPWVLAALGALAVLAGLSLEILAGAEIPGRASDLALSTALAFGYLTGLWVAASTAAQDASAGLAAAAGCTAPGPLARTLGRWIGSAGVALVVSYICMASAGPCAGLLDRGVYVFITSISVGAVGAAWGVLLGAWARAGGAILAGVGLWLLGHLPWGTEALLAGTAGEIVAAWLPGPRDSADGLREAGYTFAAGGALLCLATLVSFRRAGRA